MFYVPLFDKACVFPSFFSVKAQGPGQEDFGHGGALRALAESPYVLRR